MAALDYALYTELAVGQGHPSLSDVVNRPLKSVLTASGLATDVDPFPGFLPLAGGTRTITSIILTSTIVGGAGTNITINTDKFTVNGTSGNTSVGGTLGSVGDFNVATNKFTVAAASGNTLVAGTLAVTSDVAVATNKFTVAAATGNTLVAGTLAVTSDLAVATNKFTVAAASGNTLVAGTLAVTGDVAVNTNKFNVAAASGNTLIAGTLGVTGALTTDGGLQTFGANDSGGAGFRQVLVPNI